MQQPTPTASYSVTLRVRLSSRAGSLGELTMAIGRAGGDIGAIDIVNCRQQLHHPRHHRQFRVECARRTDRRDRQRHRRC